MDYQLPVIDYKTLISYQNPRSLDVQSNVNYLVLRVN